MSDSHGGHGAHGADHVPHVLPLKVYFATFGVLVVLTVLTVTASRFDFGSMNLVIALLIATIKAVTVAALFMHLAFDHKFHSIIIGSSIIFLSIFIGFTMFDTNYRGRSDAIEGERPADILAPFKETQADEAIKEKYLGEGGARGVGERFGHRGSERLGSSGGRSVGLGFGGDGRTVGFGGGKRHAFGVGRNERCPVGSDARLGCTGDVGERSGPRGLFVALNLFQGWNARSSS